MKERITLGRDENCDIRVDESFDTVSNEHADIAYNNGVFTFTDHSSNGSVVNGTKIKGQSITFSKGDEISLAGKFKVNWDEILRFFPNASRTTVLLDTEEAAPKSRATMNINEMFNDDVNNTQQGRATQLHADEGATAPISNGNATISENVGQASSSSYKRKKPIDKTILWSAIGAIIVLIAFSWYLFNDIIYNHI